MFDLRSARGRATLVGVALTVFLVGITAFTIWRAQSDSRQFHELERASDTSTALERARRAALPADHSALGLGSSEDAGLVEEYRQAQAALEQDLIRARADATQRGDAVQLAVLDDLAVRMAEFEATANLAIPLLFEIDVAVAMAAADRPTYLPSVRDSMPTLCSSISTNWPRTGARTWRPSERQWIAMQTSPSGSSSRVAPLPSCLPLVSQRWSCCRSCAAPGCAAAKRQGYRGSGT